MVISVIGGGNRRLMTYILSNGGNISLIKYQACLEFGDEFYR
jgi:hypothetical protein